MELAACVDGFFCDVAKGAIEIYNEFSLQHELGIRLRSLLPRHKVQFERPVNNFGIGRTLVKKEIDISVFTPDEKGKYAAELKFPRNGQHPEQMFSACRDIVFLEGLVDSGFRAGLFVIAVEDSLFYRSPAKRERSQSHIYERYRTGAPITGIIDKPTGARDESKSLCVAGSYRVDWKTAGDVLRYARILVAPA